MLGRFRRENPAKAAALRLHSAAVERARAAIFHQDFKVPDTIDGRFDLLTLHVFLIMDALRAMPGNGKIGTHLATATFLGFEDALHELGVNDVGIPKRIKAMANAFYGRVEAYAAALADEGALKDALLRNLYRADSARDAEAAGLARYVQAARDRLGKTALTTGDADFGPLPSF